MDKISNNNPRFTMDDDYLDAGEKGLLKLEKKTSFQFDLKRGVLNIKNTTQLYVRKDSSKSPIKFIQRINDYFERRKEVAAKDWAVKYVRHNIQDANIKKNFKSQIKLDVGVRHEDFFSMLITARMQGEELDPEKTGYRKKYAFTNVDQIIADHLNNFLEKNGLEKNITKDYVQSFFKFSENCTEHEKNKEMHKDFNAFRTILNNFTYAGNSKPIKLIKDKISTLELTFDPDKFLNSAAPDNKAKKNTPDVDKLVALTEGFTGPDDMFSSDSLPALIDYMQDEKRLITPLNQEKLERAHRTFRDYCKKNTFNIFAKQYSGIMDELQTKLIEYSPIFERKDNNYFSAYTREDQSRNKLKNFFSSLENCSIKILKRQNAFITFLEAGLADHETDETLSLLNDIHKAEDPLLVLTGKKSNEIHDAESKNYIAAAANKLKTKMHELQTQSQTKILKNSNEPISPSIEQLIGAAQDNAGSDRQLFNAESLPAFIAFMQDEEKNITASNVLPLKKTLAQFNSNSKLMMNNLIVPFFSEIMQNMQLRLNVYLSKLPDIDIASQNRIMALERLNKLNLDKILQKNNANQAGETSSTSKIFKTFNAYIIKIKHGFDIENYDENSISQLIEIAWSNDLVLTLTGTSAEDSEDDQFHEELIKIHTELRQNLKSAGRF
jgi:hypothetical protein